MFRQILKRNSYLPSEENEQQLHESVRKNLLRKKGEIDWRLFLG
jgi:hypothetical protein